VETRFAFRTRVLDYLWASLPMLLTSGDYFADLAERAGLGLTLPPGNADAWVKAILRLAGDAQLRQEIKARLAGVASGFTWEQVAQPLVRYCTEPYRTPHMGSLKATLGGLSIPFFEWWRSTLRRE